MLCTIMNPPPLHRTLRFLKKLRKIMFQLIDKSITDLICIRSSFCLSTSPSAVCLFACLSSVFNLMVVGVLYLKYTLFMKNQFCYILPVEIIVHVTISVQIVRVAGIISSLQLAPITVQEVFCKHVHLTRESHHIHDKQTNLVSKSSTNFST